MISPASTPAPKHAIPPRPPAGHHFAPLRIVVIEDDALLALDLEMSLQDLGHEVCACAANASEANAMADRYRPDIVTLDLNLSDGPTGVSVAHSLYSRLGIRALVISGSITSSSVEALRSAKPLGYLNKPYRMETIKALFESFHRGPLIF